MSDLTPGHVFASGETLTPSRLNDLINFAQINADAITTLKIINDAITTAKILDKNVTVAKLADTLDLSGKTLTLPPAVISGLPAITSLDDTDYFWFWDATDSALKKVSKASMTAAFQPVGSVLQTVVATYSANADLSVVIPVDDSLAQISEGTQVISQPLNLASSSNKVLMIFNGLVASAARATMAMFRDSVTDTIGSRSSAIIGVGYPQIISGIVYDAPAKTNPIYTLRIGDSTGTCRCNGTSSGRYGGGGDVTKVIFLEIKG